MFCAILDLKNSDKAWFADLNQRVENYYVMKKAERKVTAVQILLLNYQPNYNSSRDYQYNGVSNQLMFAQCVKNGDDQVEKKEKYQRLKRNLDRITCNDGGQKGHYSGNSQSFAQTKLKEDSESFRKMKQEKSSNNPLVQETKSCW